MTIGKAIKMFRVKNGLGQRQLCNEINRMPGQHLSVNALSLIETGKNFPQKETLNAICNALNIKQSYLFLSIIDIADVPKSKKIAFKYLHDALMELLTK